MRLCTFFILVILLSACSSLQLTSYEQKEIDDFRVRLETLQTLPQDRESVFLRNLITHKPYAFARSSAEKGDFALIALSIGHGFQNDAKPAEALGVLCTQPVQTIHFDWGSLPPPTSLIKLMLLYNIEMIGNERFPNKENCKIDNSVISEFLESEKITLEK